LACGSQSKSFNLLLKIRKPCPLESEPLFQAETAGQLEEPEGGTDQLLEKNYSKMNLMTVNVFSQKSQLSFRLFRR